MSADQSVVVGKPRIYRGENFARWWCWGTICGPGVSAEAAHPWGGVGGYGKTPKEAYASWQRAVEREVAITRDCSEPSRVRG